MFEQGGMTPHQALKCGTINGARYLGLDKEIGSLEPGKLADLVILEIRSSTFTTASTSGTRW